MRTRLDLNFGWRYSETFAEEMLRKGYKDAAFETVDIPHANKEIPYNYFDEKMYQFVSCYRKHLRLPDAAYQKGKRVLLHFEGAANYAVVWVNGKPAGEHKGPYTPFTFDITELISRDDNVIAVKLDSTERKEIPPFGYMVDYLVYGGIYREVWLEIVDENRIEDLYVTTPKIDGAKKTLVAEVTFSRPAKGDVTLTLTDKEGNTVASQKAKAAGKVMRYTWPVANVSLWQPDDPVLYTLTVKYADDEVSKRIGFRTARFTKKGFFLNGKHMKLIGLNRHQSYPYVGGAMPKSAQYADADLLKYKLGVNIVRTAHYPDSVHFLDRCDEIGLIVFTEMPSWQYLGEGEWRENCLDNIRSMILRDRSRACVVLWGVRVNEGQDCDEFYAETNALARALDPSRQTGGVRNIPRSHLLEDVYTYNDFSHSGGKIALAPPKLVAGNVPYLVTENNGHMFPTKSFDRESLRTEHALRHARVQNASFGNDQISGAIGWCMADYNTHKDFGSGDKICYHGVTDMFRVPKLAAAVFASQQDDFPVLENSSTMDIGDHPGGIVGLTYIFTNCDYVKVYKNGRYTSTIRPEEGKFKNLPHSPISPKDFIGDALEKDEGLDPITAKYLKKALVAANEYGFIMPPQHYFEVLFAFLHGRMSFAKIYDLVTRYFAGWGGEQITYKFEGYKNGELVKTITRTSVSKICLDAKADCSALVEDATYDVTRVELVARDQDGNRLPYCDETVRVSVHGPAKVIGPDTFALIGGARAFWLRTTGRSGDVTVTIDAGALGTRTLELTAEKK